MLGIGKGTSSQSLDGFDFEISNACTATRFDRYNLTGCPARRRREEDWCFGISGGRAVEHDVVFGTNTSRIAVSASLDLRSPLDLASCPLFNIEASERIRHFTGVDACLASIPDHPEMFLSLCLSLSEGKQNGRQNDGVFVTHDDLLNRSNGSPHGSLVLPNWGRSNGLLNRADN